MGHIRFFGLSTCPKYIYIYIYEVQCLCDILQRTRSIDNTPGLSLSHTQFTQCLSNLPSFVAYLLMELPLQNSCRIRTESQENCYSLESKLIKQKEELQK